MLMLVLGALVSIMAVLGVIWTVNYLRYRDTRRATRATRSWWKSATMGVASVGVLFATEIVDVLIALTSDPFAPLLAIWGYMSVSGLISMQPETWALVTIVIVAVGIYMRDVLPRRG